MRRLAFMAALLVFRALFCQAQTITPWQPLYKGIDYARGTNLGPNATFTDLMVVTCLKIDLTDPDIQLLSTPPAPGYISGSRETLSAAVPTFIRNTGVQVASDCNFFSPPDPSSEGGSAQVTGLSISKGFMVSPTDPANSRTASILFTTNKEPLIVYRNLYPGTNTAGIFTAITGFYPVLSNGVNVSAWAVANYPDSTIHQAQPRTAFGLSQDRRYMFMMIVDGRQSGYSIGATDTETATWLQMFGAWDGINMDGGGSSSLYRSECGIPIPMTHSSLIGVYGRERYIGSHFGVYAKPLPAFIDNVRVDAGDTTANITWTTPVPTSGRVDYGLSAAYGSSTPANNTPLTKHVATLAGLSPSTAYYFRINTDGQGGLQTRDCLFTTSTSLVGKASLIFGITNSWKYNFDNLDNTGWQMSSYIDSGWVGPVPALLCVETNVLVAPRNTFLPVDPRRPPNPYTNYYFRTHFNLPVSPEGISLTLSNYVDDGAVFYLNGSEIYRLHMPSGPITSTTLANGFSCSTLSTQDRCYGDACTTCSEVFNVPPAFLGSLVQGDNVLAVEVHNYSAGSPDIVFGSALYYNSPILASPRLNVMNSEGVQTLYWNGAFTLQSTTALGSSNQWSDVPGPVTTSPYTLPNTASTTFYRLRF